MKCAIKVIQNVSQLLSPAPAQTAPPTPKKNTPIKSTEDLIRKFPDRFQGIGQFPSKYTISLCDNAWPKVKAELDKMVNMVSSPLFMNQWTGSHQ